MKGNESTDLKNPEENALKNAIKYLEIAGFKNIVIIASTDDKDVTRCGGAESGVRLFTHAINFMDNCVERFVVKGSYTYNRWKSLMLGLALSMAETMEEVKK